MQDQLGNGVTVGPAALFKVNRSESDDSVLIAEHCLIAYFNLKTPVFLQAKALHLMLLIELRV